MPLLVCDKCHTALPGAVVNTGEPVACPGCHAPLLAQVFPALFRPVKAGRAAEKVLSDEDASCFYHPNKKAVVPCGRCGRFLCALCDIDLGGDRHFCPGCVEAARQSDGKNPQAVALPVQRRMNHDQLALFIAVVPMLTIYFTLLTAPVALFLAIRYWNEPRRALVPRSRAWVVTAALFALLEIGAWVTFFVLLVSHHTYGLFG